MREGMRSIRWKLEDRLYYCI